MWGLVVSVPDHCLSFDFVTKNCMEKMDRFYLHQMFANLFDVQLRIFEWGVTCTLSNNLNDRKTTRI